MRGGDETSWRRRIAVPFAVSSSLFSAIFALLVGRGLRADAGTFVYPLDDAYIHLAVARNLALHGVWGVSASGFSGASSSPGWTVLLALVTRVVGAHLLTPLVLNLLAGFGLLLMAAMLLARHARLQGTGLVCALCGLVLVAPLPGLALIGMEHGLHSLAALGFAACGAAALSAPRGVRIRLSVVAGLCGTAFACGALRYESCFLVGVALVLLAVRGRWGLAAAAGVSAAMGPAAYAMYSRAESGIALPFSVIMKAAVMGGHHWVGALVASEVSPVVLVLAVLLLLRVARSSEERASFWGFGNSFLAIALGTAALHAEFGPYGWLLRYEAYLYVLGAVACGLVAAEELQAGKVSSQRWRAAALLVALAPVLVGVARRAHDGVTVVAASTHDRYVEHLGQALFVAGAMPRATVLANDIGFLAWYAPEVTILDPLGLGSVEPVERARRHEAMTPESTAAWATREDARMAILHTDFPGMQAMVPAGWVAVESWCFPHNVVFANHVETFFAPAGSAAEVRAELAGFHGTAPELVRYRIPEDLAVPPIPERGGTAACPVAR